MRKVAILLVVLVCSLAAFGQDVTQGSFFASSKGKDLGACPLKTTSVKADISGFMARVTVKQEFENTFTTPIEAIYVFPLSQKGAVDRMTMTIGSRVITGKIMRREEARATYEAAKSAGQTAGLLDQERTNIFTQSVANIMPGETVTVEISYVETLKYEGGAYEFVFPMTIGPRYVPASLVDAAKVKPPVAATRAGHDISIQVNLNAGVPVEAIRSTSHAIDQVNFTPATAKVSLRGEKTIPNKDFILRYDVTGKRIEDGVLTHRGEDGGFFALIIQPPDKMVTEDRTPKEIVFVLDTSGSMGGFPIEKAKAAMKMSLDGLYPDDTFNLITFSGDTQILFETPVPATQANLEQAQAFLASRQGGGGTEMMKAIKASLDPSDSQEHLRIVCFMTDGQVGNDDEIVAEVQRHPKARVFAFGIGSSPNRSLLDRMAEAGRGEVEYVSLSDDGSAAAKRFHERVRSPLLTDLRIDWNGMPVADMYPAKLTDLFSSKPVIIHGRYTKPAAGAIKLLGTVAGQPYERAIRFDLPESRAANDSLATLWARTRVDELNSLRLASSNAARIAEIDKQIETVGLEFGLLTHRTSFVAVEDRVVNRGGRQVTVQVPIEIPEGAKGAADSPFRRLEMMATLQKPPVSVTTSRMSARSFTSPAMMRMGQTASGIGRGYGGGAGSPPPPNSPVSGGVLNGKAVNLPQPAFPPAARSVNAQGSVSVQVVIDEGGYVVQATPVSGHPLLQAAAASAAKSSSFTPSMLSGQPVRVAGVITYNFTIDQPAQLTVGKLTEATPEVIAALSADRVKSKFQAWLYALVIRLSQPDAPPGPMEPLFVRDNRASVTIELTDRSPEVMAKLTALGFELTAEKGKLGVTGFIPVHSLTALAEIEEVRLVMPKL